MHGVLGKSLHSPYYHRVLSFLRIIGLLNAAVWLGAVLFFTFAVGPAFFGASMLDIFGGEESPGSRYYAGLAAMVVLKRYFIWLYVCGGIAVLHAVIESAYHGQPLKQMKTVLAVVLLAMSLVGGAMIQPKLRDLQGTKYDARATPVQREAASRSFAVWHGISQAINLLMALGVLFYFWKTTAPPAAAPRIANPFQFRG